MKAMEVYFAALYRYKEHGTCIQALADVAI